MSYRLVFGASGYIGSHLVPYLASRGLSVRATSRNVEVIEGREWQNVALAEADALQPESLDSVLRDVDIAYYLVHSMAAGKNFPELDARAARNFADAAARQGVKRIVYLGGLVPESPDSTHLRSRRETGDILRAGSVPVTEVRAGMIIGPGSAASEVPRDLVNHLSTMVTPRRVLSGSTPIAISNLLHYLSDAPVLEETAGEIYDIEVAIACSEFRPEYGFYSKQTGESNHSSASAEALWRIICRVGQNGDFFYANWLWWLRRCLDWILGGPSFRRKRRHPDELRVGDAVDAWRVIAMQPGKQLTMLMEMKAPGVGVLEFDVDDNESGQRTITVTGYFHPAGVWGILYWLALLPFHSVTFHGMTREIAARAEAATSTASKTGG